MNCPSNDHPIDASDILARLRRLSAAEDFFALLGVSYDAHVLDVCRLHILRRMGQYLAGEDFDGLPEREVAARARATLQRAYDDFEASSPLKQRVFKVLKDHDPDRPVKPGAAFVPLDDIFTPIKPE